MERLTVVAVAVGGSFCSEGLKLEMGGKAALLLPPPPVASVCCCVAVEDV